MAIIKHSKIYEAVKNRGLINKLRSVHNQMKQRCSNPKCRSYPWYGARGISFEERWRSFINFIEDMGEHYEEGLQLDRIDVNKDYGKDNCRWTTKSIQMSNLRNNKRFFYNGEYKTLPEWSTILGIKRSTLSMRLYCYGWSIPKALSVGVERSMR